MDFLIQSLAALTCLVVVALLVASLRLAAYPIRTSPRPASSDWFNAVSIYQQAYEATLSGRLDEADRLLASVPGGGGLSARFLRAMLHECRCGSSTKPTERFRHEMEAILADTPDYPMALAGLVWYSRHHELSREVGAMMPFVAGTSTSIAKMLASVGIQLQLSPIPQGGGSLASLLDRMMGSPPSNEDNTKEKTPDTSPPGRVLGGIGDDGELPRAPEC